MPQSKIYYKFHSKNYLQSCEVKEVNERIYCSNYLILTFIAEFLCIFYFKNVDIKYTVTP